MLTVISPAKSLDFDPVELAPTRPGFLSEANRLARTMRGRTLTELRSLMDLSPDLARLNRDRFRTFAEAPAADQVKPAILAFDGDTYRGLEASSLDPEVLDYAQDHLRILSGLYGLLRPLDAIQPYRLEMGTRLKTRRGANLYDYWGDMIAKALNAQAACLGTDWLLNCASQEYFAAADHKSLKLRVVTPQFFELRGNQQQMVSFFAKRARGAMARFVLEQRVDRPEGLRDFAFGGYRFDPTSPPDRPVFTRNYVAPGTGGIQG